MCLSCMNTELMCHITEKNMHPSHVQDIAYTHDIRHSNWLTNLHSTIWTCCYKFEWSLRQCILDISMESMIYEVLFIKRSRTAEVPVLGMKKKHLFIWKGSLEQRNYTSYIIVLHISDEHHQSPWWPFALWWWDCIRLSCPIGK